MDQLKHIGSSRMRHAKNFNKVAYFLVFLQVGIVTSMTEDFYNPDYDDLESYFSQKEIQNGLAAIHPFDALENQLSGNVQQKRHLGSVARLSGGKQRTEPATRAVIQMPKRHLGAFVGLSGVRHPSPSVKRHLGSVASKQGFRSSISSLGRSSDSDNLGLDKRHMGAFTRTISNNLNRVRKANGIQEDSQEDGLIRESMDEQFYDYPSDLAGLGAFKQLEIPNEDDEEFQDEPVPNKAKRFLGSLARVGWFPRQFRGIVSDNPYEKRHIGSAARMGWLPSSQKWDRLDEGFGENSSFKRNIQSIRKSNFAFQNPHTIRALK